MARPNRDGTAPKHSGPQLAWEYLAHSEIGLVRKNNQDSGLVGANLVLVADGMGGAAAGDLASAVAVDTISRIHDVDDPDRLQLLAGAISAANTRIADLVTTDHTLEGMGTTVTAAILDGDQIDLAHIGDSRAYLLTDSGLEQLTHDHSWVQSLIDEGKINAEEAAAHPHRSLLLKVLNGQPANEPDLRSVPVSAGQRLLLCSDGLCGFVDDDDIAAAMRGSSRDEAMAQLVQAAHQAGGLDNITIIIADLYDPDDTAIRAATGDQPARTTEVAGQRVSGPTGEPQFLGAAAERDASSAEEMVAEQAALRAAAADDIEGLDEYDEYEDDPDADDDSDDEARYAPQPPSKRRWRRPLALTLVVLLIIAAAASAGYAWTRTQYYVGADNENVAIFQGLNQSLPGISLSHVYEVEELTLQELPPYYQTLVRSTIDTGTLDAARATVAQLEDVAERCPQPPTSPGSTGTPGSSGSPKEPKNSSSPPTTDPPPSPHSTPASSGPTDQPAPTDSAAPTTPGELPGDAKC